MISSVFYNAVQMISEIQGQIMLVGPDDIGDTSTD